MPYQRPAMFFVWLIALGFATGYSAVRADTVPLDPTSQRWKRDYEPFLATAIEVNDIATLVVTYQGKREVVRMKYVASRAELEARQGQPIKTIQIDSADIDRALRCRALIINHLRCVTLPHEGKVLLRMAEPARNGLGQLVVNDVNLLTPTTRLDGTPGYILYGISEWHLMGDGFALPIPDRWNDKWRTEEFFIPGRLDLYEGCKKNKRGMFRIWVDELLEETDDRIECTIPLASVTVWPRWKEIGTQPEVYFARARVVLEATNRDSIGVLCQHADDINIELRRLLDEADDDFLKSNDVTTKLVQKLQPYVKRKLESESQTESLQHLRVVEFEIARQEMQ